MISVDDDLIGAITLYKPRYWLFRYDVFPFLFIYSCFLALSFMSHITHSRYKYIGLIGMPISLTAHLVLFLVSQWSTSIKSMIGNTPAKSASHIEIERKGAPLFVHVHAAKNAGKDRIICIQKNAKIVKPFAVSIAGMSFNISGITMEFQKVIYDFSRDMSTLNRLDYPERGSKMDYLNWRGHSTQDSVYLSMLKWGKNEFDIPIPNFLDLYLDHLIAPFFVFQMICLFLWSLDDYWYYSAFTLLMLMFFEGMMCKQRLNSLEMLRNMRRPAIPIFVYRMNEWSQILSDLLVPGDVISISGNAVDRYGRDAKRRAAAESAGGGSQQGVVLPCDAILIRGTCVVNEAMLTGESVPQMKETLRFADESNESKANNPSGSDQKDKVASAVWRRHTLFSGTSLMLHNEYAEGEMELLKETSVGSIPSAPDGGCHAVVIKTAFGTSQGELMRKILFAQERITGSSSMETVYFIAILVIFAMMAATTVLFGGLYDEKRNKFRLVLHCIMIITSVVPPELPMELSLAVTNSLAALAQGLVYCTEPFRISYGGKLNVLCFDKTGTLTKDKMILKGVVASWQHSNASDDSKKVVGADQDDEEDGETNTTAGFQVEAGNLESLFQMNVGQSLAKDLDSIPSSNYSLSEAVTDVYEPSFTNPMVLTIMGTCHDLMPKPSSGLDTGELIGDPLEIETISRSGFLFESFKKSPSTTRSLGLFSSSLGIQCQIKFKYPFTSALKRMSIVVEVSSSSGSSAVIKKFAFSKGAPEVVLTYLHEAPAWYKSTYYYHMSRGKRVLAIAFKPIDSMGSKRPTREMIESQMTFAGFLIFDCDMKADSRSVIKELKHANHAITMITGDSVYTGADVARKLGMFPSTSPSQLATVSSKLSSFNLQASSPQDTHTIGSKTQPFPSSNILVLQALPVTSSDPHDSTNRTDQYQLVWRSIDVPEDSDGVFMKVPVTDRLPHESLTATNPGDASRKSMLINIHPNDILFDMTEVKEIHEAGAGLCVTGMALNQLQRQTDQYYSHVMQTLCPLITVFARVSPQQKESIILALNDAGKYTLMCGDGTNDVGALKSAHVGVSIVNDPEFEKRIESAKDPSTGKGGKGSSSKDRVARALREYQEQESDPTIVKLGDASIASPFTARRTSIDSILTVIRQGRCTLVTTIQVYKILALNCLVSAYMMSALYLKGLKQGDTQMTASGLIVAVLFFFLSQGKPLPRISTAKPPGSVFALSVMLSILGQFIVHMTSLWFTMQLCDQYTSQDDMRLSADGKFQPNIINSSMYLLSSLMQINNFVINYRGHPFTQSIQDNVWLWRSVQVLYVSLLILAGGQFEPLNDLLQMVPFPSSNFQAVLVGILLFNFTTSYLIEQGCRRLE